MANRSEDNVTASVTLKAGTARMLKWNLIDRVATQVLYAVTGIVLARLLSPADFGLAGAVMVFQAFANMFIDSGFSSALIQRKSPRQRDYSTVFWFNIGIALLIYATLYIAAGGIAGLFGGDTRMVPMSRVMFLSFIFSSASLVQANRLTKRLDARPVAIADIAALAAGGITGITLAVTGHGAWAIVWQTVVYNALRTALLWVLARWTPSPTFSWRVLRSYMRVGSGVMATSFLNVLFQNIYSFFVGNRAGLGSLGYYTQGDKWSKMGIMSVSQTMTSSFLPALSSVQDDPGRYRLMSTRIHRFAAYVTQPSMGLAAVAAPAIFHLLFDTKWDAAIMLFSLLCVRGIFTVMTLQYNNFVLSLGRARAVVWLEVLRDAVSLAALLPMLPLLAMTHGPDMTYGLRLMICGQLAASAITWLATLIYTARLTGRTVTSMLADMLPGAAGSAVSCAAAFGAGMLVAAPAAQLALQSAVFIIIYLTFNHITRSEIQREALMMIFRRKKQAQQPQNH